MTDLEYSCDKAGHPYCEYTARTYPPAVCCCGQREAE